VRLLCYLARVLQRFKDFKGFRWMTDLILLGGMTLGGSTVVFESVQASPSMIEVGSGAYPCFPETDPLCRKRVKDVLMGLRVADPTVLGGVRIGEGTGVTGAVSFSLPLLQANLPMGDLQLIGFEAIALPGAGGFRIRLTALEGEALYFCRVDTISDAGEKETRTLSPFAALSQDCRPESAWGLGGTVVEYQNDSNPDRWGARWLELHAVYNLLRNGHALSRLTQQLHVLAGAAYESTHGSGGAHVLRGNLALSGMIRSSGLGWELRGYAGYRPNLIEWDDWAAEARLEVLYRLLFHRRWEGHLGLSAEYAHWSKPERSLGAFASSADSNSAFLGLIFGVSFR